MKNQRASKAYSAEDLAAVADNPALTGAELSSLRPAREVLPGALFDALPKQRVGRPKAPARKISLTLRIDPDVVAAFKSHGAGWQTRMNEALRRAALRMR